MGVWDGSSRDDTALSYYFLLPHRKSHLFLITSLQSAHKCSYINLCARACVSRSECLPIIISLRPRVETIKTVKFKNGEAAVEWSRRNWIQLTFQQSYCGSGEWRYIVLRLLCTR